MQRAPGWLRRRGRSLAAGLALLALTACTAAEAREVDELRLGHLLNLTHAPAFVGTEAGTFEHALGPDVDLTVSTFSAGPAVIEALYSGALDAAYIGPNPAINGYTRSGGDAVRVVAGAVTGGAALVVRPGIDDASDLVGTTLATPQIGNTQDIALRAWLHDQGFEVELAGGGDVELAPQPSAQILETFRSGAIDGAWVPEPWASRLVLEADGQVLVDEADLWPDGRFVTTTLVVRTELLETRPDLVRSLITGHLDALDLIAADPDAARDQVGDQLGALVGTRLDADVERRAWDQLSFGHDPEAAALATAAGNAVAVGLLDDPEVAGLVDRRLLDEVVAERRGGGS